MPNQQLAKLNGHGQRFWLDRLLRNMLDNAKLKLESHIRQHVVAIVDANGLEQSGLALYGRVTSVLAGRPTLEKSVP